MILKSHMTCSLLKARTVQLQGAYCMPIYARGHILTVKEMMVNKYLMRRHLSDAAAFLLTYRAH